MSERWKNLPFLGTTCNLVPVPKRGGTGIRQRQSGTGTDQSGTRTDASSSPDFCTLALLSPKFVHR